MTTLVHDGNKVGVLPEIPHPFTDHEEWQAREFGLTSYQVKAVRIILEEDIRREVVLAKRRYLIKKLQQLLSKPWTLKTALAGLSIRSIWQSRSMPTEWNPAWSDLVRYAHLVLEAIGSPAPKTEVRVTTALVQKVMEVAHVPATEHIQKLGLVPGKYFVGKVHVGCHWEVQHGMTFDLIDALNRNPIRCNLTPN